MLKNLAQTLMIHDQQCGIKTIRYSQCTGRAKKYPLKNFANSSRTIERYDIKFYTLLNYSIIRTCGKFHYIIYRIDKLYTMGAGTGGAGWASAHPRKNQGGRGPPWKF